MAGSETMQDCRLIMFLR